MNDKPHIVERAFQIARSGQVRSTDQLIKQLKDEGYESYNLHIVGSLRLNLRKLIKGSVLPAV